MRTKGPGLESAMIVATLRCGAGTIPRNARLQRNQPMAIVLRSARAWTAW